MPECDLCFILFHFRRQNPYKKIDVNQPLVPQATETMARRRVNGYAEENLVRCYELLMNCLKAYSSDSLVTRSKKLMVTLYTVLPTIVGRTMQL